MQEIDEVIESKQINWIISTCYLIRYYHKHSALIFGEKLPQHLQITRQKFFSFSRPLGCLITS